MKSAALICARLASASCFAGTGSASFSVNIQLAKTLNTGVCVSETLSAGTGATVYVVCASSQFVDIRPIPGRPFACMVALTGMRSIRQVMLVTAQGKWTPLLAPAR